MSRSANTITAVTLIERLVKEGFLKPENTKTAEGISTSLAERVPIYLQVFSGLGAFLSAIPFLAFLGISELVDFSKPGSLLIWGTLFMAAAIPLGRTFREPDTLLHSYLHQAALIMMGTGKLLLVWAGAELLPFDEIWGASVMLVFVTGLTFHLFGSTVDRFLSSFFTLFFIGFAISVDQNLSDNMRTILFNAYFIAQLALAGFLATNSKIKPEFQALYYALAISLARMVLDISGVGFLLGVVGNAAAFDFTMISVALALALTSVVALAVGRPMGKRIEIVAFAGIGAIVLALLPAPGILLALILLVAGHHRYDKYFSIIGLVFLAYFLFEYYFSLQTSLLEKSIILAASGLLLLAGRFYVSFHTSGKWGGEKTKEKTS